jgi:hypothetical protein
MKKYFVVFFIILVNTLSLISHEVSGIIIDSLTNTPLPGVSITLAHSKTSLKIGDITNKKGAFSMKDVENGSYNMTISYVGYASVKKIINVFDKDLNIGKIYITEKPSELGTVEVIGQMPAVEMKGDTTLFNADAFKTNPDASAEDLVQKMPGVVMQSGKVQAQGEDIKKVLMDGKPFYGDDPTAALRNLPAEIIDKVQIFDQKSEQSQFTGFDDGNNIKTMNIITRTNMRTGQIGKTYAGYGTDDKYQAGTNFNIFGEDRRISILAQFNNLNQQNFAIEDILGAVSSMGAGGRRPMMGPGGAGGPRGRRPGGGGGMNPFGGGSIGDFLVEQQDGISATNAIGLNYTDNWGQSIKVTGSYFVNYTNNDALNNLTRDYITENQLYYEDAESSSKNINHRFNFRFEYDIDSSNSLLIRPRVTYQQNEGESFTLAQTDFENSLLNRSNNDFNSELSGYNLSNEILWRHKFETKSRTLSLSMNNSINANEGENKLYATSLYKVNTFFEQDTLNQKSVLDMQGNSISYNLSYTEPIFDKSILQINYSGGLNNNESDKTTNNYDEISKAYTNLDTTLSNIFESNYLNQSLGTSYQFRTDESNLTAGVSYQWSRLDNKQVFPYNSDISREFNNVLPNLRYQYNFTKKNNLRIFYRTSTDLPSISQLQDVVNNNNPLQISIGNPELEEGYQHNLFANFMAVDEANASNFFFNIGGRYSNNYIGTQTTILQNDSTLNNGYVVAQGAQISQPVNLKNYINLRSFINYGFPISFISSNLNINTGVNYTITPGIINNLENYSHSKALTLGIVISSNISKEIDFSIMSFTNLNFVNNTLRDDLNTQYLSQSSRVKLNLYLWETIVFNTEFSHQYYSGLSSDYNQSYFLLSSYIGYKMFDQDAELRLSANDILNQNSSINRSVSDIYIQDTETNVLQRYFILSFIYTFKNFGARGF